MINRAKRTQFVDSFLSASLLLSLCAVIVLGPHPNRVASGTQNTTETLEEATVVNTVPYNASQTIRQTSAEKPGP